VALNGKLFGPERLILFPGDRLCDDGDSGCDQMIVVVTSGDYFNGGTTFAFRYDPLSDQVLWAKEYVNSTGRNYGFAVVEKPNGNYVLASNPHPPLPATSNDDELFEISQTTGAILPASIKVFNHGGSDATGELIIHQGFIYGTGRYTDGLPNTKMRNTMLSSSEPINRFGKIGHIPGQTAGYMERFSD
jgi:hypothetical protein